MGGIYLFIGEFAMYQVFAQMKHNLNFDAFYVVKLVVRKWALGYFYLLY